MVGIIIRALCPIYCVQRMSVNLQNQNSLGFPAEKTTETLMQWSHTHSGMQQNPNIQRERERVN